VADEAVLIRFWLNLHVEFEAPSLVFDASDGFGLVLFIRFEYVAPAGASSSARSGCD
jgi:hypothetical protein